MLALDFACSSRSLPPARRGSLCCCVLLQMPQAALLHNAAVTSPSATTMKAVRVHKTRLPVNDSLR